MIPSSDELLPRISVVGIVANFGGLEYREFWRGYPGRLPKTQGGGIPNRPKATKCKYLKVFSPYFRTPTGAKSDKMYNSEGTAGGERRQIKAAGAERISTLEEIGR